MFELPNIRGFLGGWVFLTDAVVLATAVVFRLQMNEGEP